MSDTPPLGRRPLERAVGDDAGEWAASEVTKHEELCGLRYEAIYKEMAALKAGVDAINARAKDGVKYVAGIIATLGVALIMMFLNNAHTQAQADESDKRELRARLSLLTTQMANFRRGTVVVAPAGTRATTVPDGADDAAAVDPTDLAAAAGADPRSIQTTEPKGR